jgi:hypothetical protein
MEMFSFGQKQVNKTLSQTINLNKPLTEKQSTSRIGDSLMSRWLGILPVNR